MKSVRLVLIPLLVSISATVMWSLSAHGDESDNSLQSIAATEVWALGPLPAAPVPTDGPVPRGKAVLVPEIRPGWKFPDPKADLRLPDGRKVKWATVQVDSLGALALDGEGVFWLAARLESGVRQEITLKLAAGSALYADGEMLAAEDPGTFGEPLEALLTLNQGSALIQGRVIQGATPAKISLVAESLDAGQLAWTVRGPVAMTRFGETDRFASFSSLAIAGGGKYSASRMAIRGEDVSTLRIHSHLGKVLAADIGGDGAQAVGFTPNSKYLLLKQPGESGTDLVLWNAPSGPGRVLVREEPDLGTVRLDPKNRFLLMISSQGFEGEDPADGPGRLWTRLRERVADWTPALHLHLVELESGTRRVLTWPGDYVLDDAVFGPKGKTIYYGRTVPIDPRPWFKSEIRRLDLTTGSDELLAEFTAGWEVRPQHFAVKPNGKQLIFLGPPHEYKDGAPEQNVYHKQVWALDLESKTLKKLAADLPYAFDGQGGLPAFDRFDRLMVFGTDGNRNILLRLEEKKERLIVETQPLDEGSVGAAAVSPAADAVIYALSDPGQPDVLYWAPALKPGKVVEKYNMELGRDLAWTGAQDHPFTGPGGETIDCWFFPPLRAGVKDSETGGPVYGPPDEGTAPLIVYFYGGGVPTLASFSTTFQFFAANGYGVVVVNPRGAYGYGEEFANHHAGDWGPKASDDVLAATDHILATVPWLDPERIGIYGGSYGGFLTDYLVTITDRYAAAVSMYGISDLATYWGQGTWGWTYGDMALGGETPWGNPEYFNAISPLYHADRIQTPLLLLHGAADNNVTPGESTQLFTALSIQNKPVAMVQFPGEGHGISGTWENRVAHRDMMLEWFDRFLRNRPEAWEARWE